jgi:Ca2+-binding RTX toxin-like protein
MSASRIVVVGAVIAALFVVAAPAGAQDGPTCFGEPATIVAEPGVLTIGTDGADVIVGTSGPDIIRGLRGDDLICGWGGNDVIRGNGGRDSIHGGAGADVLYGGLSSDILFGGRGADTMHGKAGRDILRGAKGNDELFGGNGNDTLWGRSGDDLLEGGNGHDSCKGGAGENELVSCNEVAPHASRIHAFGDSVMLGAGSPFCNQLAGSIPGIIENATVSRQFSSAQALVSGAVAAGVPDDTVFIVALGTNGPFSSSAFDALFTVDDSSRFLFVNVKEPRSWEASVNSILHSGVNRHRDRAGLVDWHKLASGNSGYLAADGIHMSCSGAAVYADALAHGLRNLPLP